MVFHSLHPSSLRLGSEWLRFTLSQYWAVIWFSSQFTLFFFFCLCIYFPFCFEYSFPFWSFGWSFIYFLIQVRHHLLWGRLSSIVHLSLFCVTSVLYTYFLLLLCHMYDLFSCLLPLLEYIESSISYSFLYWHWISTLTQQLNKQNNTFSQWDILSYSKSKYNIRHKICPKRERNECLSGG